MSRERITLSWHINHDPECNHIVLAGDWLAQSGKIPQFSLAGFEKIQANRKKIDFDATALGYWDTGLIAFLRDVHDVATSASVEVDDGNLPAPIRKLLELLPPLQKNSPAALASRWAVLNFIGQRSINILTEVGINSGLLAETTMGGFRALFGQARMRIIDLTANIRAAGPAALLIVSVVNFLIGAILAFVGAVQLRKFAADIYVANLVGLALVREMAAVMTAIVMAGRTGGAYAAKIATMQGNEEIDALTVIGIPLSDYIILPAVLALVFTMPFLYLYGCLVGMFGGYVVSIAMLNITTEGFVHQTLNAVPISQFVFGFGKSIAFAILIGVMSCRIGLKAGRSAADVGNAATHAVVVGIVGVIAMDASFAVIADLVGI